VHLRVLIDGKVCRLSERTKRGWVCPNAPEPAAPLSKEFSPRPHDAAVEYREVMRIIGELTESLGDRLTIKFMGVNDAYARRRATRNPGAPLWDGWREAI